MKVIHIIGGDVRGGAAKGALILHKELIRLGVTSCVLKQVGEEDPTGKIYSLSKGTWGRIRRKLYTFLDRFPLFFYRRRRKDVAFSLACFGFDITKSKHYRDADIVNLHWINQGTLSLRTLKKIKKPIVWTIRDMWMMTGGCHHSFDCTKYEGECGSCPVLGSTKAYDLSSFGVDLKRSQLVSKIKYVTISKWLKDSALRSRLLKNEDIDVIYNGIDIREFVVIDKHKARNELRVPLEKKIVLLGASNLHDIYKGFSYFLECLPALLADSRLFFLFFGHVNLSGWSDLLGDRFISFGPVVHSRVLNTIYSAADVFIAPSIAEAFGKTLVESMLSGTPVVCFDNTGPAEIVSHRVNGYKAVNEQSSDLCDGVFWCLEDSERLRTLSYNARVDAQKHFSGEKCAFKYKQLYEKLLPSAVYPVS